MQVYPLVILVALLLATVVVSISYDIDHPSTRLGGDYPAFFGAGEIAREGDWSDLYSGERQQEVQAGLIDDDGGYLYFSYPPFVAAGYGLLAGAGYQLSFLIHTLLMGLALWASIRVLRPWLDQTGLPEIAMFVAALAFYPVLRAIPGGQNTTISLLLFAGALRLDHEERPVLAGFVASLLLFKPQFGVIVLPVMLVAKRWRMVGGWAFGAAAWFGLSTLLMGGTWVSDWWNQARSFGDLNLMANGKNFVSFVGVLENGLGGDSAFGTLVGYTFAMLVGLGVAYFWWKHPAERAVERWALLAAAAVVVAPQTLFYDAGLLLLGGVALGLAVGPRPVLVFVVAAVVSWSQLGAGVLDWSPLGPVVWGAVVWLVWRLVIQRPAAIPVAAD